MKLLTVLLAIQFLLSSYLPVFAFGAEKKVAQYVEMMSECPLVVVAKYLCYETSRTDNGNRIGIFQVEECLKGSTDERFVRVSLNRFPLGSKSKRSDVGSIPKFGTKIVLFIKNKKSSNALYVTFDGPNGQVVYSSYLRMMNSAVSKKNNNSFTQKQPNEPCTLKNVETVLLILDCSKSMAENIKRNKQGLKISKFDEAKDILLKVVKQLPECTSVGLRAFGYESSPMMECQSTALIMPFKKDSSRRISSAISKLKPAGLSPLTYALHQGIEKDLKDSTNCSAVILLTDGVDTCGHDPAAYARTLKQKGVDVPIHTIGLDIRRDFSKKKLKAIATTTGGIYYDNSNLAEF